MMSKPAYSKFNLFIRSLIFSVFSVTLIILYSIIVLVTCPLLSMRHRHWVIRGFSYSYMYGIKKICHIDYVVEGMENIPKDRVAVVMSKHQSTWETFFLALIFHSPAVILKRELFLVPFFGWALALGGPIAINRRDKSSAMQQVIKKGKKFLDEGRWVLIFPEGTRTAPGVVGKYHMGGARLAVATHYPVIPVALNSGRFWPRRKFIKKPGTIRVVIGPIIESEGRTPEEVLDLTKDWIESTMVRIDGFVNKSTR